MQVVLESNYELLAARVYDNPGCFNQKEFEEDLKRIKYLKRLFNRYKKTGKIKERLVLNHLIIFYNVFEKDLATKILFLKLDGYYHILKPFLSLLGFWPEDEIKDVGKEGKVINTRVIKSDPNIVSVLKVIWQV
jgi:hypothetical protein